MTQDELNQYESTLWELEHDGYIDAPALIRKQQAEIEFLKKEILEKHEDWKHEGQQAANARAEIEALKVELDDIKQYNMDRNLSE